MNECLLLALKYTLVGRVLCCGSGLPLGGTSASCIHVLDGTSASPSAPSPTGGRFKWETGSSSRLLALAYESPGCCRHLWIEESLCSSVCLLLCCSNKEIKELTAVGRRWCASLGDGRFNHSCVILPFRLEMSFVRGSCPRCRLWAGSANSLEGSESCGPDLPTLGTESPSRRSLARWFSCVRLGHRFCSLGLTSVFVLSRCLSITKLP